jgi:hypothetical protein
MTGEAPNTQKALRGIEKLRVDNERFKKALRNIANLTGEDYVLSGPRLAASIARAALGEDK